MNDEWNSLQWRRIWSRYWLAFARHRQRAERTLVCSQTCLEPRKWACSCVWSECYRRCRCWARRLSAARRAAVACHRWINTSIWECACAWLCTWRCPFAGLWWASGAPCSWWVSERRRTACPRASGRWTADGTLWAPRATSRSCALLTLRFFSIKKNHF